MEQLSDIDKQTLSTLLEINTQPTIKSSKYTSMNIDKFNIFMYYIFLSNQNNRVGINLEDAILIIANLYNKSDDKQGKVLDIFIEEMFGSYSLPLKDAYNRAFLTKFNSRNNSYIEMLMDICNVYQYIVSPHNGNGGDEIFKLMFEFNELRYTYKKNRDFFIEHHPELYNFVNKEQIIKKIIQESYNKQIFNNWADIPEDLIPTITDYIL
jgi:hypothetical protein